MPNGRHGAVLIPREEILRFLDSIDGDPVVGTLGRAEVLLSAARQLVKDCNVVDAGRIFVEGQHLDTVGEGEKWSPGIAVVLHLDRRTGPGIEHKWLWVMPTSVVYEGMKRFWLGWLGRSGT